MMDFSKAISSMKGDGFDTFRQLSSFSWGTRAECKQLLTEIFLQIDKTVSNFDYLPEYDDVVEWMVNTRGKGLLLHGDCGRGKSVIITGVIPVLLRLKKYSSRPIHADQLRSRTDYLWSGAPAQPTNLDYLYFTRFPIIDEVGVESIINNFGEKYDPFNRIMNDAERSTKPVFISTNLTPAQLLERYDERTIDRLIRLCKTIEFRGESLRK